MFSSELPLVLPQPSMKLNRRDNNAGADEPASIQNTDVLVKPTWRCLRRLAGLSALVVNL
jgi:hypothetical protein